MESELGLFKRTLDEGYIPFGRFFISAQDSFMFEDVPLSIKHLVKYAVLLINLANNKQIKFFIKEEGTYIFAKKTLEKSYKAKSFHLYIVCKAFPENNEAVVSISSFVDSLRVLLPEWEVKKLGNSKFTLYLNVKDTVTAEVKIKEIDELLIMQSLYNDTAFVMLRHSVLPKHPLPSIKSTDAIENAAKYVPIPIKFSNLGLARAIQLSKASNIQAASLNFILEALNNNFYNEERPLLLTEHQIKSIIKIVGKDYEGSIRSRLGDLRKGQTKNELIAKQLSVCTDKKEEEIYKNIKLLVKQRGEGVHKNPNGEVKDFHRISKYFLDLLKQVV